MCGRFVASRPIEDLVEEFGVDDVRVPEELLPGPRFNISPQAEVLAVRDRADDAGEVHRRLGLYRWGLVPSWAKDPGIGAKSFNARAETLAERPMFRSALAKRRCIVPADAFYEWQRLGASAPAGRRAGRKQPWCFRRADGGPIAFAGLYEVWREREAAAGAHGDGGSQPGDWLLTCTIITTDANGLMAPIHDRMPVVLLGEDYDAWLSPEPLGPPELAQLLRPVDDDYLVAYEVGTEVGNSRAEGPGLVEPLDHDDHAPER